MVEIFILEQVQDAFKSMPPKTDTREVAHVKVRDCERIDTKVGPSTPIRMIASGPAMPWRRADSGTRRFTGKLFLPAEQFEDAGADIAGWLGRRLGERCQGVEMHEHSEHGAGRLLRVSILARCPAPAVAATTGPVVISTPRRGW